MTLRKRLDNIEQSPVLQREQRLIAAIQSKDYSQLSDDDLLYLEKQFEQAGIKTAWDADKLRTLGLSDPDIDAIQRDDWNAISDAALALIANTPDAILETCQIIPNPESKPR